MDYIKVINLILDNPANTLTTTSRDLLETMRISIELDKEKQLENPDVIVVGAGMTSAQKEAIKILKNRRPSFKILMLDELPKTETVKESIKLEMIPNMIEPLISIDFKESNRPHKHKNKRSYHD